MKIVAGAQQIQVLLFGIFGPQLVESMEAYITCGYGGPSTYS